MTGDGVLHNPASWTALFIWPSFEARQVAVHLWVLDAGWKLSRRHRSADYKPDVLGAHAAPRINSKCHNVSGKHLLAFGQMLAFC